MKFFRRTAIAVGAMLALSAPAAAAHGPAPAPVDPDRPAGVTLPGAALTLFVTDPERSYAYSTSLQCLPNGGDHSDVWTACYVLKKVDGDFEKITPREERVCTEEYKPVVFTAFGHWKGREVHWSKQFPNQCAGEVATDGVFEF